MYKTWTASSRESGALSRDLEAHLNEFADEVISVAYAVADQHYVLAVYKQVEMWAEDRQEIAVAEAEHIIEGAQS